MTEDTKKDIEFYVNKERGIVVCKIWNCSAIAQDRIYKYIKDYDVYAYDSEYRINDVYVGTQLSYIGENENRQACLITVLIG